MIFAITLELAKAGDLAFRWAGELGSCHELGRSGDLAYLKWAGVPGDYR